MLVKDVSHVEWVETISKGERAWFGTDEIYGKRWFLFHGDQVGGGFAVRSYVKPFANWLWGGSALMALGGFFSLTDRRYRLAAGARRQTPSAQPAE